MRFDIPRPPARARPRRRFHAGGVLFWVAEFVAALPEATPVDITKAEFWDVPNTAGLPTFSFDELVAELIASGSVSAPSQAGKGCRVVRSPTDTVPDGFPGLTVTFTSFPNPVYDDLLFYDGTTGLVIPTVTPAIERVQLIGQLVWSGNATGQYNGFIHLNGGAQVDGLQSVQRGTANTQYLNMVAGPVDVVPGDKFELLALQFSSPAGARTLARAALTLLVVK